MTDNHYSYVKSHAFTQTLQDLNIDHWRIPPRRPQLNGKIERFHRTLTEEWAYHQPYPNNQTRLQALQTWLNDYNYTRPHTALNGKPPASRL